MIELEPGGTEIGYWVRDLEDIRLEKEASDGLFVPIRIMP